MLSSLDNTTCLRLRHSDNSNLHLHRDDTFDGLPVMTKRGPLIREHLSSLKRTIELAMAQYSRVLAIRVDLHLPQGIELPDHAYENQVISDFFESFRKRIQYHQEKVRARDGYARGCKVRYVWAREIGQDGRPHYHVLILLNGNAYFTVGRLRSERVNMISRMQESWANALRLPVDLVRNAVHITENAEYQIDQRARLGDQDQLPELFYRASYLCKEATKSFGDRQRSFDTSRG
ncbi:TPA: inovirus Gp2 family protein [Pseudomonas aeruginosa]|uniref:inovirus Gp2 family protein n=1 Tax=Pseudomonas aeruginosa TaxID=287 RepID=UPI001A1A538A|nr:inovirus Gp2 family protein [Pseudomonas aeruginosa]MCS8030959.1 inovirus Gp2 family protein [Pseudomonas aeruginosa]HBO0334671.1 inovirus Gp2 family protein [Pseudomonas aeruginosa]HCF0985669.1 inovirus Gp2 family protein [Pseudomonas aeruginosa]HEH6388559.1 inovirus Gp2 family protein [Pseudomonas aeruginosa]